MLFIMMLTNSLSSDAAKFKEAFEKVQKNDFTGLDVIKQDAEDAEKAGEKKEEKKAE